MELYISDHPLDCLTCSANNDCELQDQAANVGLRDVRYGYAGENHLGGAMDKSNPYFAFDSGQMHRLFSRCVRACGEVQGTFALTDGRARLCQHDFRRAERWTISCLPNASAAGPACRPARHPTLRKSPSRQSASPNARSSPPAPIAAWAAPSARKCAANSWCGWCRARMARPTAGHSCVKGRFAWGYANHQDRDHQADDPRHRSTSRGSEVQLGGGDRPLPLTVLTKIKAEHGASRAGRDHLQPLHQ